MAISPTTPNQSSSSSSSQPPLPATQQQQLPTRLESQRNTLQFSISGGGSNTTPHHDQDATTSNGHGRRVATFDLNFPSSEPDVGVQVQENIPPTIRLTNLKQLARANRTAELENPVQKKKSKNEPEDNSAGPEENIHDSSQQQLDVACQLNTSSTVRRRRNRCLGRNGRTCHQCHQKTLDFVASCNSGREETPCTKAYCVQCIWNRYGVMVEVAHPPNNWRCPSCRGICNCGRCMKEEGFEPVGIRGRVGKTARFLSVMERLAANSSKNINEVVDHKETSATEESVPGTDGRKDAGNSNSMEVHLSGEVNPRFGVEEEKSQSAGDDVKNISNFIKTVSSRNDVLSVLLSPSRSDYESLLQPSDSV